MEGFFVEIACGIIRGGRWSINSVSVGRWVVISGAKYVRSKVSLGMINPIHFQLTRITCYPISSGQNNRAPLVMLTSTSLRGSLLKRKRRKFSCVPSITLLSMKCFWPCDDILYVFWFMYTEGINHVECLEVVFTQ